MTKKKPNKWTIIEKINMGILRIFLVFSSFKYRWYEDLKQIYNKLFLKDANLFDIMINFFIN